MGILKSLFTLGKSFISQAEESIEETQGVRMLEQHIRDAKAELDKAGKSRVDLLARVKLSHDKLKDLRERKASLEARALEALSKNVNPSLINEVAEEIARLENLITAEVWGSDQFWAEFVQPGRACKPCVARGMVI